MVLFPINLLLSTIISLTNVLSFLLLRGAACLLIVSVKAFKIPGEGARTILELAAEAIKSMVSSLLELLADTIMSMVDKGFELFVEAVSACVSMPGAAVGKLLELAKDGLEAWPKMLEDVIGQASQMVGTIIANAWENCVDAVSYLNKNF